ncbi:hypothetical protein L6258_01975, partial [Candidatus Parcubacteria bacterium]|nr:hypothetical protein [Candidatus Parcubacteria bacterium]
MVLFQERRGPSDSEGTKPIQQFAPKARTKRNRVPPRRGGVGIYIIFALRNAKPSDSGGPFAF